MDPEFPHKIVKVAQWIQETIAECICKLLRQCYDEIHDQ